MLKAYLAIASKRGLVAFAPERAVTTARFLDAARRLDFDQAVCWWAVLSEEGAAEVASRLEHGELVAALYALNQQATRAGRVLPAGRPGTP